MKSEHFYPVKCRVGACYWQNICDHKGDPAPTRGCYTHMADCKIQLQRDECTCRFKTFNFRRHFEKHNKPEQPENAGCYSQLLLMPKTYHTQKKRDSASEQRENAGNSPDETYHTLGTCRRRR